MKIAIIGFGTVGQGFAELVQENQTLIADTLGSPPQIVAVVTRSRGSLYHPDGLYILPLIDAMKAGSLDHYPDADGLSRDWDALRVIKESNADVVVEVTYSDFKTAEPATGYIKAALTAGRHVITANKGPIALHYAELSQLARAHDVALRYEGTVMAGTPVINTALESLAGAGIRSARGIINGSTNYILSLMEDGHSYDDACAKASELGYLEADPSADVDGWDAAGKVLILCATVFGRSLKMDDLTVTGIRDITLEDIATARENGERYKLIAEASPDGGRVELMRLSISDPLATVGGATNAITFQTGALGPVTIIGAGAGRRETGFAVLNDLLAIGRKL